MSTERHAIVRDGIVEAVTLWDGNEETWKPADGAAAVRCDDQVSRGWTYSGGQFAAPVPPAPTFAQLAAEKGQAIAAAYAAAVGRGYRHRDKVIQIDPESRQNIDSMALLARMVINEVEDAEWPAELAEKGWRTLDNTHLPMTPTQMVAMSLAVAGHFVAIRFRASAIKDALAAAVASRDAAALDAIDPASGWP